MTSVVIVADSAADMARLTAVVHDCPGMTVVRHVSGRAGLASVVADCEPALVLLGEMSPRRLVLESLAEIRQASPATKVVVAAKDADAAGWVSHSAPAQPPSSPAARAAGR